jgi:hypothetical protein
LQHGGARRRAAEAWPLAVDQADLVAERRQVLGHHGAGDAGADDEHFATPIALEDATGRPATLAPRRMAAP